MPEEPALLPLRSRGSDLSLGGWVGASHASEGGFPALCVEEAEGDGTGVGLLVKQRVNSM